MPDKPPRKRTNSPVQAFFGLFVRPFSGLEWHLLLKKYIANFASKERKSTKQNTYKHEFITKLFYLLWQNLKWQKITIFKCKIVKFWEKCCIFFRQCLSLSFDKLDKLRHKHCQMAKNSKLHIWKWIIFAISRFSIIDEIFSAALHFLKKSSNCTHFFHPPA